VGFFAEGRVLDLGAMRLAFLQGLLVVLLLLLAQPGRRDRFVGIDDGVDNHGAGGGQGLFQDVGDIFGGFDAEAGAAAGTGEGGIVGRAIGSAAVSTIVTP